MIVSSSKLWGIKREISTVQATWITSHWIVSKRFKHQERSWCIQPWEVDLRWTKYQNLKLAHSKHKKVLAQSWTQLPKSTWSKWTKSKKREPNLLLRRDLQTWCLTSRTTTWTNMQWLTAHLLTLWSIRLIKQTSEVPKVNLQHRELTECKYYQIEYLNICFNHFRLGAQKPNQTFFMADRMRK